MFGRDYQSFLEEQEREWVGDAEWAVNGAPYFENLDVEIDYRDLEIRVTIRLASGRSYRQHFAEVNDFLDFIDTYIEEGGL